MILFGHPTGNPNSHHAALAYWETGKLEAFCVPWFPEKWELNLLKAVPGLGREVERLSRRRFESLAAAPKVQGRVGEWGRLIRRKIGGGEKLSYEGNDWLMKIMARESLRPEVKAVHSYEDCSLWQFQAAKRRGKACIYDMPIGYYGWWQRKEEELAKKYRDWLPPEGLSSNRWVRPEQKKMEIELADVVLVPSEFVAGTIRQHFNKQIIVATYGTDTGYLVKNRSTNIEKPFRVLFVGTASVRKGVPMLLETWRKLGWKDAELFLVGSWQLGLPFNKYLPPGAKYLGKLSRAELAEAYSQADWLVHPSNFEGFSLSVLEALGVGLPVLASTATGAADLPKSEAVRLFDPENPDQLAEALIAAKALRGKDLSEEARLIAARCSWEKYRKKVRQAVKPFLDQDED